MSVSLRLKLRGRIRAGKVYLTTLDNVIYILDATTGEIELCDECEYESSGLGFEPSPVLPLGDHLLVVGTRRAIYGLEWR